MKSAIIKCRSLNESIVTAFLFCLMVSCKSEDARSRDNSQDYHTITAKGEIIKATYTFCSFVPSVVSYTYRSGTWLFVTDNDIKIAEGDYDVIIRQVNDEGGCPYQYYEHTVNPEKWQFWNLEGKKIAPTEELIAMVESRFSSYRFYGYL